MVVALTAALLGQVASGSLAESEPRFEFVPVDISLEPRKAPKYGWRFTNRIDVLGRSAGSSTIKPLFRIYSQSRETSEGMGMRAGKFLVRLWDIAQGTLRLKHPPAYGEGTIDVYLCDGGTPGGEQLLGREILGGRVRNFNAIFVFQIGTLDEPLEAARELAHEYGHAVIPAVGGFVEPEDWGNGYLGERLFLHHLRTEMQSGRIAGEDAMGADSKSIAEFCSREIDPSVAKVAKNGPDFAALKSKGPKALEAYLGFMMYLRTVFDDTAFARALALGGSRAAEVPAGAIEAINLEACAVLRIPSNWVRTPVWIPIPARWKTSDATITRRIGDWAVAYPKSTAVKVSRPAAQMLHR